MTTDKELIEDISQSELDLFNQFCKLQFGFYFNKNNESILLKAINYRLKANALTSYLDYYQKLVNDKNTAKIPEQKEFVCLLTINETYFYREEVHLQFMLDSLVPKLQAQAEKKDPLRILCVGCSTGAEPYSIAMALHQRFGSKATELFTIIGADIDSKALAIAKSASYGSMAFRSLSAKLKQRYFVEQSVDGSLKTPPPLHCNYKLNAEIKQMVSWQYLNIVSDIIDPTTTNIDIVFFRNVSIYFSREILLDIHQRFTSMLNQNGYLIVGLTESMSNNLGILVQKNEGGTFYFQNEQRSQLQKSQTLEPQKHKSTTIENLNPNIKKIAHKNTPINANSCNTRANTRVQEKSYFEYELSDLKKLISQKNYNQALSVLELILADKALSDKSLADSLHRYNQSNRYQYLLLRAFIYFNHQEFELAYDDTINALALNPFSVDIFLLLGMITKWQNQLDDAISWFKKALYVYADCWPAHYYLAGLYHQTGNTSKARHEYLLVVQQLNNPQENFDTILSIPLKLPKSDMLLLSQSYLKSAITTGEKRYGT